MCKKIESFLRYLVRLRFMRTWELEDLLLARRKGDTRGFGEIALGKQYLHDDSVKRYVDYLEKEARTRGD